jgi:hypothetical protein
MQWMASQDIIRQLLRSNLHQRQYMEQVRDILAILTQQQMLQEEHLQLLWDVTEKVRAAAAPVLAWPAPRRAAPACLQCCRPRSARSAASVTAALLPCPWQPPAAATSGTAPAGHPHRTRPPTRAGGRV